MPEPTDPFGWVETSAAERVAGGLRRTLRPRTPEVGMLDLASNDYLGLCRHPRVIAAAAAAAGQWGAGSTGSRLVTGSTTLHAELESAAADFTGAEAALVFSSGYLANLGAVTALSDADTLIVADARNHASLVDACRLSRARVVVAPHRDTAAVERALTQRSETRALVVTDGVFSVDGELAPLTDLLAAARRHGAALIVDEAHGLGVVGDGGRGLVHAHGLAGAPDIVVTAVLSKSLGSQGGLVLGPRAVIEHLVDTARSFIFDTALAPANAGAALAALTLLREQPKLAERVRRRARELSALARELGLDSPEPRGAVCSVLIGQPVHALAAQAACASVGVRVGCFRPPSVPDGISRLRLTARADLTDADLALARRALESLASDPGAGACS
ncbi:MAG: 8-amino-7-oxononanoate synthase [Sporichthyaceae bacterium]